VIFEVLHQLMRKGGHLLGYGILGYLCFRALIGAFSSRTRLSNFALAIACSFLIASLDEWNQSYSPARTGQFSDVLLDTFGALLLVSLAMLASSPKTRSFPIERSAKIPF
jgi:VanZ family protein